MGFPNSPFPDFGPAPNLAPPLDWEAILDDCAFPFDPSFFVDPWHDKPWPWKIPDWWKPGETVQDYGDSAAEIFAARIVSNYEGDNFGQSSLLDAVLRFEREYPRISERLDLRSLALVKLSQFLARLNPGHEYPRPFLRQLDTYVFDRCALRYVRSKLKTAVLRELGNPLTLIFLDGEDGEIVLPSPSWRANCAGGWDSVEAFCRTLPGKHADIARLAATGMKKSAIARQVGMSYDGVKYAFRSMREKAQEFFGSHYPLSEKPGEE